MEPKRATVDDRAESVSEMMAVEDNICHRLQQSIHSSTFNRDLLVKPLLEAPSLRCVELAYKKLVKICHNCTSDVGHFTDFAVRSVLTHPCRNFNDSLAYTFS